MSGAEAFAVLGVISSIIAIIDQMKKAYDASTNRRGLPETFREAVGRLPIVRATLESAKQPFEKGEADEASCKGVMQIVEACQSNVQKLDEILQKTMPGDGASFLDRYYKTFKVLGKGNKVEDLMERILKEVQLLAGEHCMRIATASQQTPIAQAITDLSALPSSIPEDIFQDSSFAANNFGPGTQANAPGGNIALDEARQYNSGGGTMNIGDTYTHTTVHTVSSLQVSNDTEIRACLSAVFLTDPKDDREALKYNKGSRVDGTCTWIKGHELYVSWLSSDPQLLWLSGGPGKGKTMLSLYLAQDLEQSIKHSKNTILLQYFCDNKDERRNTATAILRGLIFQLLQARRHLFTHILPSYQIQKESLFSPSSFQTLWRIFETMLHDHALDRIYCVLDGLDECEEDSVFMILDKFKELFMTNPQGSRTFHFNLIITSRDVPDVIPQLLSGFPRIRLDPDAETEVNEDIDRFIKVKVKELSILKKYPPQLREYISETFRERAQGTFLWVGIVANELRNYSNTEVVKYLNEFPPGLNEVYARILFGIEIRRRKVVAKILRWTVMAVRPLSLAELGVAIGTSVDPIIQISLAEITRDQISWCGNLLTITGDKVNLIHQSAKDYLLRKVVDSKSDLEFFRVQEEIANLEIASKCFYYLQEGALADGPVDLEKSAAHLARFPLLAYAVIYWPLHARSLSRSADLFALSNAFYQKTSKIRDSWLQTYSGEAGQSPKPQPSSTLLHIVSYFGILPLAENVLLEHFSSLEEKDGQGRTALRLAVEGGHEGMVRLLLDKGADFENIDHPFHDTALYIAVRLGHEPVIRLLLQAIVKFETRCDGGRETTLHRASGWGHEVIVQLLLKNGANIEAKGSLERVALHYAVDGFWGGCTAIVRLLLDNGANASAKDLSGKTPLDLAKSRLSLQKTDEKREIMLAIIRLLSPDG